MRTMSYSERRATYAETLSAVVDDREEVIITRAGHDPVMMVSLDEYESLRESCAAAQHERGPMVLRCVDTASA